MTFDMNQAWSRANVLARENFSLLAVIAGLFILLPTLVIYLMVPGMEALLSPSADPEILQEKMLEAAGPLITWGLLGSIIQYTGYGAMVALMGDGRPTVAEALGTGAKSVATIIAAFLIFAVLYMVAAIVIVTPFAMLAGVIGVPGLAAIAPLLIIAVALFLMTRFSMTMPVVLIEKVLNPFRAVKRSWDMTRVHQWRILVFWAILGVAYIVISLLLVSVFGLIASFAGDGTASKLILGSVNGLMAMVVGIMLCALAVAIHGQLAGPSEADVTSTFE
ncbi:hypothetical protein FGU71_02570 [Erythrobacter insulae]|uniref:Glycerophosphoryl diester phosphodiesterase membrane domain-containing protein n=1 Tax=Erythrobacter insulae TaxID=2584124 RepID=A0A547P9Q5_9SPHN|nr:glycerophosphoryl diester phosphodiesterase membrane domain-containing protein [Erythrobacter insulae]TRD10860.1 hypothetical protein FGU71_02570 [Erythrobacter insulae]